VETYTLLRKASIFSRFTKKIITFCNPCANSSQPVALRQSLVPIPRIVNFFLTYLETKQYEINVQPLERRSRRNVASWNERKCILWFVQKSPWKDPYIEFVVDLEGQKGFPATLSTDMMEGNKTHLVNRSYWGVGVFISRLRHLNLGV